MTATRMAGRFTFGLLWSSAFIGLASARSTTSARQGARAGDGLGLLQTARGQLRPAQDRAQRLLRTSPHRTPTSDAAPRQRRRVGGDTPIPPLSEPNASTFIILEVSAFQDGDRCALTLRRALERAAVPSRVKFHVVQARSDADEGCAESFRDRHLPVLCDSGPVRLDGETAGDCSKRVLHSAGFWTLPLEAGEGPAHQRGLANMVFDYEAEDAMCLSTDSHMDFAHGWDNTLIEDWASTRNEFAVLTTYVAAAGSLSRPSEEILYTPGTMIELCGWNLENGIPRGRVGAMTPAPHDAAPPLTINWAAGMSFHRCHMERAVPVDWHLRWMFTGEEIDRAVRLFTSGYDMYSPTNLVVTHNYSHAVQRFWSYGVGDQDPTPARTRVEELLRTSDEDPHPSQSWGRYGLGKQRTLEDFVRWSKIDLGDRWRTFLAEHDLTPMADGSGSQPEFCRSLERLPLRDAAALKASVGSLRQPGAGVLARDEADAGKEVNVLRQALV